MLLHLVWIVYYIYTLFTVMVHVQKFLYKCLEAYQNKGISKDYETLRAWGEDSFKQHILVKTHLLPTSF